MNKTTFLAVLFVLLLCADAEAQTPTLFTPVDQSQALRNSGSRDIIPTKFRTFRLDVPALRQELSKVTVRNGLKEPVRTWISFPFEDGHTEDFLIEKVDVLHPDLGAKYPEIGSFMGSSRQNPLNVIYLSLYDNQFRGLITGEKTIYMDPLSKGDDEHYIVYDRSHLNRQADDTFVCHTKDEDLNLIEHSELEYANRSSADGVLRTYRIAIACTSEYSAYYGNTIAGVLAAVNTTITRVNSVYRRDLNVTFQVVPTQNRLIYINNWNIDANPDPDPYDNYDGSGMLSINTSNITGLIGANAYDIGHVFSTGGGGIASTSPCNSSSKGAGVTGIVTPEFDPFDIDYVCHEIGHQFGAGHTYYNACFGQKVNDDYEPGSGSTILGYAGICAPNVQANSDAYFHARSIAQMTAAMTGHTCESETASTNTGNPTISALTSYTIPKGTPFVLTGSASDSNSGDVLTYCWEQYNADNGGTQPPTANNTVGPVFRSMYPTTAPSRYFPNLESVINNSTPVWEVLPNVARSMAFRLTVRDNHPNGGRTNYADMTVTVASSGPFSVTAPNNTGIVWYAGDTQTVTWNVNNTTASPVNTANVKISLSTDGGYTYPIVLLESTPNDGSQAITVPNVIGKMMRIKVQAINNIYYDISNNNFEIKSGTFELNTTEATVSTCKPANAVYNLTYSKAPNFNQTVTFSAVGLPAGASASFSPASRSANGAVTMTITGLSNTAPGHYSFDLQGTSSGATVNTPLTLKVFDNNIGHVTLSSPENGAENQQTSTLLSWSEVDTASAYQIQISTDPTFGSITETSTVKGNTYQTSGLTQGTIVYWRVKPLNSCVDGTFSETFVFQIASDVCRSYNNVYFENNDNTWNTGSNNAVSARIDVPDDIQISDVNFTMVASHTQMTDIKMQFSGPTGIFTEIYNRDCSGANVNVTFDDQGSPIPVPCTGGLTGTRQSSQPLAKFNGSSSLGTWVLLATDRVSASGSGTFTSLSIQICGKLQTVNDIVASIHDIRLNNGAMTIIGNTSLSVSQPTATNSELIYVLTRTPVHGSLKKNNVILGQGGTFTQADINSGMLSYTHAGSITPTDSFVFSVKGKNNALLGGQEMMVYICDMTAATMVTDVTCAGQTNGSASVVISGGTGPYRYQWAPTGGTESTAQNLSAGEYTCMITDAAGCELIKNISVSESAELFILSSTATNISCFGAANGEISLTVTGGVAPYTYDWSPGNPSGDGTPSVRRLTAANYSCIITDSYGCSIEYNITLSEPEQLTTSEPESTPVTCNGGSDGSALLVASGGKAPYYYDWFPAVAEGNGTGFASGLTAGMYICVITDANGCSVERQVTIEQAQAVSVIPSQTNVTCFGAADGDASVLVSGANGINSYQWQPEGLQGDGTPMVTGLSSGTYTCLITFENGCNALETFTITEPATPLSITYEQTDVTCLGDSGSVSIIASGGTAPYSYLWLPDGGTSAIAEDLAAGTYICTVSDSNGCYIEQMFTVGSDVTVWDTNGWSNGSPSANKRAIINHAFIPSTDLTACSLEIRGDAVVTVPSGINFYITNKVTVDPTATLLFESDANLVQYDNVQNEGAITSQRSTVMKRLDYTYWASPVADQNLKEFSPLTVSPPVGSSRFYVLHEPSNGFVAIDPRPTSFEIAKGYMVRSPNNFPNSQTGFLGSFTGVPHNGDINIGVTFSGVSRGYNLIGNPYPSTIDAMEFLSVNPGTLYFWTHRSQTSGDSNYASFNISGAVAAVPGEVVPNGIIQTGQGFLYQVEGSGTVNFNNGMRRANNDGQFFRTNTTEKHRYWLNLYHADRPVNQIMVNYMEGATMEIDHAIDGPLHPAATTSIGTLINDIPYSIQGRPLPFTVNDEIPMQFMAASSGIYTIKLDSYDGLFSEGQQIYVHDQMNATVHNLSQSAYTFTSEAGTFGERFKLVYQNTTLPVDGPTNEKGQIIICRKENKIGVSSTLSDIQEIRVYDILGRLLFDINLEGDKEFTGGNFTSNQVLLVKVKTKSGIITTKKVL
jgi:hypothetical protein